MDRYGRITFEDGMNVAQGLRVMKQDSVEQEAFAVADKLYKGKGNADLNGHSPEAQVRGASLYWEMGTKELDSKIKEKQLSTEGMRQQVEQFKLQQIGAAEQMKVFQGLVRSGHQDAAKEVAREIFNNLPNGRFVKTADGGKLEVTNWDMSKMDIDDPTIEEYQDILGSYFSMPLEEQAKAFATGAQLRRQKNLEVIGKAEPYVNPQTGKLAYLVPAGTWDPNGQPRGSFFVDGPTENAQEIPQDQVANLMPLKAYKQGRAGTAQMQNYDRASQDPGFAAFLDKSKGGNGRGKTDFFDDPAKMVKTVTDYWGAQIKRTDDPTEQRALQSKYDADLKRAAQGQMPSFLSEGQPQNRGKIVRTGKDKETGKRIAQYEDGSIAEVEDLSIKDDTKKVRPLKPKSENASVVQRGQKFYKVTDQGEVEMTPEEIKEWKETSGVSNVIKNAFGLRPSVNRAKITGTHTPANRGY